MSQSMSDIELVRVYQAFFLSEKFGVCPNVLGNVVRAGLALLQHCLKVL